MGSEKNLVPVTLPISDELGSVMNNASPNLTRFLPHDSVVWFRFSSLPPSPLPSKQILKKSKIAHNLPNPLCPMFVQRENPYSQR